MFKNIINFLKEYKKRQERNKNEIRKIEDERKACRLKYEEGMVLESKETLHFFTLKIYPGANCVIHEVNLYNAAVEFDMGNHCTQYLNISFEILESSFKIISKK